MGLLSSFFGKKPSLTKHEVAGQVASVLDYVISDAGFNMLLQGNISLDKKWNPNFRNGRAKASSDFVATANIADLKESDFLRNDALSRMKNAEILAPFIDQLAYAVVRHFESSNPEFASLPN